MARPVPRHSGFTLIELLIVVGIIALLAAILFPVFAQARAKGRQAACLSNMHQLGLALTLYQDDYDETLMPGHAISDPALAGDPQYAAWAGLCNVYARSPQLFRCPADDSPDGTVGGQRAYALTYFLNSDLVRVNPGNTPIGLPRGAFVTPALTVLLAENTLGFPHAIVRLQNPGEIDSVFANTFSSEADSASRHQGGRNFLLADGHARWLRPTVVSTGTPLSGLPPHAAPPDALPHGVVATFAYQ